MAAVNRSQYMTPQEAAEKIGVTVQTIWRWIKAGKVDTIQMAGFRGRHFIARTWPEGERDDAEPLHRRI